MKCIFTSLIFMAMLLYSPSGKAYTITLAENDVKFLRSCVVEQADIDVIKNLPSAGQDKLGLILESSRRNCEMAYINSFKTTREYLRRFTPNLTSAPMPPDDYDPDFLTVDEKNIISKTSEQILKKLTFPMK